jgi:tripartite-type tricarboxylate transporter receptor subunit TctC
MKINIQIKWFGLLACLCFLFLSLFMTGISPTQALAAVTTFPENPISLVVPMGAGGYTDIQARILAEAMEKELKQPVVVVNKAGGAYTVGGYAVASAKPDGYTLGLFPVGPAIPESFTYFVKAPYLSNDLKPICRIATPLLVITVRGDAPWNSIKDLVEYARKNPRMKYEHSGKSSVAYAVMVTIAKREKLEFVDVTTKGDVETIPDLLGGHIPVGVPAYPATKALVEAKKLKLLAMCIDKRAPFAPDIPTVVELGYNIPYVPFLGIFAPKKTPNEVIKKLEATIHKIFSEDKVFQNKSKELDSVLFYEEGSSFEKALVQYKANLYTFYKEEGMIK